MGLIQLLNSYSVRLYPFQMKICILHPSYEDSAWPAKEYDCNCDPAFYLHGHQCENHMLRKTTALRQMDELVKKGCLSSAKVPFPCR